ncbi:MAG: ATP-binding protein, partial [Armatimonadetes bacterium]|nr:ATP-binding protein [Armatimonadota bacterium]
GTATLRLKMYSDRFVAVVEDSGSGFVCPFEAAMPPASSRRGRGIPMMKLLMDEVRFDSGGGCTVTLVKYLRPTTAH